MRISELDPNNLTKAQISKLLFDMRDDGETGDCIFVAGSSKAAEYRVPVAVELYLKRRALKLLFSGGRVWKELGDTKPEAVLMKERALQMGVPEKDILIETRSLHTLANAMESRKILQEAIGLRAGTRILLVTTAFHMRRLYLSMKTHFPPMIKYSYCVAQDRSTRHDNWWTHESGVKRATEEARKLIEYVRRGHLVDDEL